jgi:hypothetical protein
MLSDSRSYESEPAADLESRFGRNRLLNGLPFQARTQKLCVFNPHPDSTAASRNLGSRKNFFEGGYYGRERTTPGQTPQYLN